MLLTHYIDAGSNASRVSRYTKCWAYDLDGWLQGKPICARAYAHVERVTCLRCLYLRDVCGSPTRQMVWVAGEEVP
jgi:hypothetical protein